MAEIIDCSRGIGADTDYIYLGKTPPWYTEEEWKNRLKEIDNSKMDKDNLKLIEDALAELNLARKD